jgi:urease accessory protein
MHNEHREGRHTPVDPGPMAPHFHAPGEDDELFHAHAH